jgi:hypothetical protein
LKCYPKSCLKNSEDGKYCESICKGDEKCIYNPGAEAEFCMTPRCNECQILMDGKCVENLLPCYKCEKGIPIPDYGPCQNCIQDPVGEYRVVDACKGDEVCKITLTGDHECRPSYYYIFNSYFGIYFYGGIFYKATYNSKNLSNFPSFDVYSPQSYNPNGWRYPNCTDKQCGSDGIGGNCGCNPPGEFICVGDVITYQPFTCDNGECKIFPEKRVEEGNCGYGFTCNESMVLFDNESSTTEYQRGYGLCELINCTNIRNSSCYLNMRSFCCK